MFKFINSKKGFTLVELMIVLILLGFGAFAIINLTTNSWRTFSKSEMRYEKQEDVKNVAMALQNSISIGAASRVELYNTTAVLPTAPEQTYNYIYVDPTDSYLYVRAAGSAEPTRISQTPLFISFNTIYGKDIAEGEFVDNADKSRGVTCSICALDADYEYTYNEKNEIVPPESDIIFYSLDVAYHFANMMERDETYVNRMLAAGTSFTQTKMTRNGTTYTTIDTNAIVMRFISDITLDGSDLLTETNPNAYCFIATASYGADSGEVGLLCDFRDNVLMQSAPGRAFVKAYYTVSPPIAKVIAGSEPLKAAVRLALKPLVIVATFALDRDLLAANMAYIIILMITAAAAVTVIVYCSKKRKKE